MLATFLARLLFASALGLGIDESYMVAAGRKLQLSYFDHPPIAWWMAWGASHLFGSESGIVVRLPFIALFALTTWLMYRLTSALFGPPAGLWAAIVLNAAPVLGISTGTWVLPDGPLFAGLLGAVVCLIAALPSNGRAAWGWWLGAGACAGLALCSKYSAVLTILGVAVFLLSEPAGRCWLMRPHPYAAGTIAVAIFLPVLIWNAEHGWVSFLFQGGRASGGLRPFGPFVTFAGAALYLLPWIWLPLMLCGFSALRGGPSDKAGWLLACLAAPPIVVFAAASLWSNVLFHWAAPGYLMLVPLLGDTIARHWRISRSVRIWTTATAVFVIMGAALFVSEIRFNWLPISIHKDPSLDIVDWTSLRAGLADRGLLDRPGLVIGAMRWSEAGKIDYALGGRVSVVCLGPDARQYGLIAPRDDYAGADVLILVPRDSVEKIIGELQLLFDSVSLLPPMIVLHSGRPAMTVPLLLGRRLHRSVS